MITVSSAVAQALSENSRHFDLKLYSNNAALNYNIAELKMYKGACSEFKIGSVFIPYIEATVEGAVTPPTEVQAKIAVEIDGEFSEYYPLGYFKTQGDIDKSTLMTKFIAQGRLADTINDVLFTAEPETKTLASLLTAIRSKGYTVTLKNGLTVPNIAIQQPLIGITVLDALQIIALCTGAFVTEDNAGGIVISKFVGSSPAITFDGTRTSEVPIVKGQYNLTGIRVKVSENVTYECGSDIVTEIDNPYFTADMVSQFTANVVGMAFNSIEAPISLGDFRLEPWDIVNIEQPSTEGLCPSDSLAPHKGLAPGHTVETLPMPCLNIEYTYDGGLLMNLKSPATLPEQEGTKRYGQLENKINEAYDRAAAANNLASSVAEDLEENYPTYEETEEMIEAGGGSDTSVTEYRKTQFARGTTSAPVGEWSDSVPTLTSQYPYLWSRTITIQVTTTYDEDTGEYTSTEEIVDYGTQVKTTLMDGVYAFISGCSDGTTTINGGCITTGSINANLITTGSINANLITSGKLNARYIDITKAMYTGSHTTLTSYSAGAYFGPDGVSFGNGNAYCMLGDWSGTYQLSVWNQYSYYGSSLVFGVSTSGMQLYGNATINGNIDGVGADFGSDVWGYRIYADAPSMSTSSSSKPNMRYLTSCQLGLSATESTRRIKHDIKDLEFYDPTALYDLHVREFVYNDDWLSEDDERKGKEVKQVGLIAEEVAEIFPQGSCKGYDGLIDNWNEREFIPVLLKLIQDQHREIEELKERLA